MSSNLRTQLKNGLFCSSEIGVYPAILAVLIEKMMVHQWIDQCSATQLSCNGDGYGGYGQWEQVKI
jgi:hypothetical protein